MRLLLDTQALFTWDAQWCRDPCGLVRQVKEFVSYQRRAACRDPCRLVRQVKEFVS